MLNGKSLSGQAVVAYTTGEEIDRIETPIINPYHRQVVGFVVQKKGLRRKTRVLPWSGIHAVLPIGVIARSKNMLVEAEQLFEIKQLLEYKPLVPGVRLMTTNGYNLGLIVDVYFEARTGAIEGYETSDGVFADTSGSSFIPAQAVIRFERDAALLPPITAELLRERPVSDDAARFESAKGRRVRHAVRTSDGWWVAASGQIVTNRVLERARRHHKERDLLESVGLVVPGKIELPPLPRFMPSNEMRIQQAIGRDVRRMITDRQGLTILAAGSQVTQQVVQKAQQAGVLEELLNAIEQPYVVNPLALLKISEVPLD